MAHADRQLCGGGVGVPGVSSVQRERGAGVGGPFAIDDSPHGELGHERQVRHRAQHFLHHAAGCRRIELARRSRLLGLLLPRSGSVRM